MKYKLITFDAYSALLDIKGSLIPELEKAFPEAAADLVTMFTTWRARQWDYVLLNNSMNKGFLSYSYITRCALDYTLLKFGMACSEEAKVQLVNAWSHLLAWPEARDVVEEIKRRGYPVAILSNGDEVMLKSLEQSTGIVFDHIFCAEQAQAYKPSPKIYRLPFDRLGLKLEEVLHVAGSSFDMMGAKAERLQCFWSNRLHDFPIDPQYKPDYEFAGLRELLSIL